MSTVAFPKRVAAREAETIDDRLDYARRLLYLHGLLTDREHGAVGVRLLKYIRRRSDKVK